LISIEFTEGSYERGAAHGNSNTTVVITTVKNGKKLALAESLQSEVKLSQRPFGVLHEGLAGRAKKKTRMRCSTRR